MKERAIASRDNNKRMSSVRENRIRKDFQKEAISKYLSENMWRKQYRPNKGT